MDKTPETATNPTTFVLAGRKEDGVWQRIETASLEEGDTVEDVKGFLQTLAHANSRNFLELDVISEEEFNRRNTDTGIAA